MRKDRLREEFQSMLTSLLGRGRSAQGHHRTSISLAQAETVPWSIEVWCTCCAH